MTFHEQLMRLRRERGMTQEELAQVAGVSRQTVSKWELGETTPELEKLYLLCDYFGMSMDELTGRSAPAPVVVEQTVVYHGWRYEYRSERELWGLPLVHINIGPGFCRAKGVFAVGNIAQGVVAVGSVAAGGLAIGGAAVGALSIGGAALGLVALGGLAAGGIALGGCAAGIFAVGGLAAGRYIIAGAGAASRIAAGDTVTAPIAIGAQAVGDVVFRPHDSMSIEAFAAAVHQVFPRVGKMILRIFYACLRGM